MDTCSWDTDMVDGLLRYTHLCEYAIVIVGITEASYFIIKSPSPPLNVLFLKLTYYLITFKFAF